MKGDVVGSANQLLQLSSNNTPPFVFIVNQLFALALAAILALVYIKYGRSISNRKEFSNNFILLSMTTMLIITIVKSSLALSLGLVGALSIVRFRTAIKEPEELSYIFISIAIGLGLGANQLITTLIGFSLITLFIIARSKFYRFQPSQLMNLTITSKSENDFDAIVKILSKTARTVNLKRISEVQDGNYSESAFSIDVNDYSDLITIRNELKETLPGATLHFLDSSGILTN